MLTNEILKTLKNYVANMQHTVTFVLQTGDHVKRNELLDFLHGVAGVTEKLAVVERDMPDQLRSPISFLLEVNQVDTGIRFTGIPSGHEFNSLVLAMMQASGVDIKLDQGLQSIIKSVDEVLSFDIFVSLSCHNCPDVVQTFNQFALLNRQISAEMIDGGLNQALIAERDIQGVPSVYLNGEWFASGKITAADIMDKLIERMPDLVQAKQSEALPLQDMVVIGGGPAGVSSAIYGVRKGLKVTLITDRIGGQVKDTMGIENLISVPQTTGPALTKALIEHINEYDITVKEHLKVVDVEQGDIKKITLSSQEEIFTKTVIVATGAKWRELGVPGEQENIGKGVAYCPHCDGPFFKGKDVAVVGGGNSGIEAALDLAGIVKSVTVLEFLSEFKADKVLLDQAIARDNITLLNNVATKSIEAPSGKVESLVYVERASQQEQSLPLAGVFVQIGLVPNSAFIAEIVKCTRYGEIEVNEKCETSEPGIYATGDVTTVPYKQIVVAMGEGAKAALAAFEYLLSKGNDLDILYESQYLQSDDRKVIEHVA